MLGNQACGWIGITLALLMTTKSGVMTIAFKASKLNAG
jgi:hypothetical protein